MALTFENTIDEWQNEGTEPSNSLKESGFTAGYKPPASVFNWFWSKVSKGINEIQAFIGKADTTAAKNSENLITSGAVYKAVEDSKATVDTALSLTSTNPVANSVVAAALNGKSDTTHTHDLWDINVPVTFTCTAVEVETGGTDVAPNEGALTGTYELDIALSKENFQKIYAYAFAAYMEGTETYAMPDGKVVGGFTSITYSDETDTIPAAGGSSDKSYYVYVYVENNIVQKILIAAGDSYVSVSVGDISVWNMPLSVFKATMFT